MATQKILLIHASAGHGHEKAAKAVEEALRGSAASDVRLADSLSFTPPFFGTNYKNTYLSMIKRAPWLWGFLYGISDWRPLEAVIRPLRRLVNGLLARGVERLILEENPSVIVSTHFMSTEIAAFLKKNNKIQSRLVTVITDFLPHEFWLADQVDIYVVAAEETKNELVKRGVLADKVRVFGIPVNGKFAKKTPASEIAQKLGLRADVFTVLLTGGGAGVGSTKQIASKILALNLPLQLLVVCGTNQSLYADLSQIAKYDGRLKVFGFVDNMDELMGLSHIVVGKGGGLTVSEALAKEKPMIVFEPVPGQETRNAECLKKHEAGLVARNLNEVVRFVQRLATHPGEVETLAKNARTLAKPNAAKDIAEMILK